jgi:hypothetical protein
MTIPKLIAIGTHRFEVIEKKRKHDSDLHDEHSYGYTIEKDNVIVLDAEMPLSMKRVTLFHEVLHAIRMVYGGSFVPKKDTTFDEWEHYFIGIYEEPFVQVLQANPEFVKFLLADEA